MTKSLLTREADGTIKLTITLPFDQVDKTRKEVTAEMAKNVNLPGFRKGKAPTNLAEDNLNPDQVRESVLQKMLPQAYIEAVTEHKLKPIINPKMHIEQVEEGADWVFHAVTCEFPEVNLGEYKKAAQAITAKGKIVIPGKENEQKKPAMEEVIKAVLEVAKVKVPGVLVEQETDRLLAQLLDDVKRLGLSLEQYLGSTKRSPDDLRNEYAKRAEEDIKLEFVLQKIAEAEKITVEPQEIEEAIQKAKDPKEKANLEANRYVLAGILRQQKTLDLLINL